jgi:hypothetical protein
MRHDSTREIAAAVREATAPLLEKIARMTSGLAYQRECTRYWHGEVGARDATIMELRDHLSQAHASLAEMTRCRTAADLQRVRETPRKAIRDDTLAEMRQPPAEGTTYPWHRDPDASYGGISPNPDFQWRSAYQRTDEDGPMWRPEDVAT